MKRSFLICLAVISLLIIVAGCSGNNKTASVTPVQDFKAPEWVVKGSGAFSRDNQKVFYGVGTAYGMENPSLLRTASENRARSDIAKVFQVYTSYLMKDYMASTMDENKKRTSDEQHTEQAVKTVAAMTISGVEIVDHWQDSSTGEIFSLARLDLEAFKENLNRMNELKSEVKEYIKNNAERLHEELQKEEEKMEKR
jgi:hypothetical protein